MVKTKVNRTNSDYQLTRPTMKPYLRFAILLTLLYSATAQDTVLTPPIGDRSRERRVEATSTCGLSASDTYCRFLGISRPPSESLSPNCVTDICDNTCPHGDTSPTPIYLEDGAIPSSVTSDISAPSQTGSSLKFSGLSNSFITRNSLPDVNDNNGFSFASWLRIDNSNTNGVLVSRNSTNSEEIFNVRVSSTSLLLSYLPLTGSTLSEITIPSTTLLPNQWYHLVVTVYQQDAAVYINGIIRYAVSLIANVKGPAGVLYLGRGANGRNSFSGNLDVPTYFTLSLTEREAFEAYSGSLSFLHQAPNCRCPPSNPVVSTTNPSICIQHPGLSTNRPNVARLNMNAHPPSYSNDNITNSYWLSDPPERMVNITFTLSDKLIEVLFLLAVFSSPRPQSLVILKSADNGLTFTPLQYYSDDCMGDFGLVAGADITFPSEVVCLNTFSLQAPVSTGLISLNFFNEGRPGSSSFNTNLEFRDFIAVNQIRLSFRNFFNSTTTDQHLYYAISTLTAAARCKCNGHAANCIYTSTTSTCQCQHNTQGDSCEECTPLYNDKPWMYGIPCTACNCNNHADSCVYNQSLDVDPNDITVSGGGVCISCKDNTRGRFCDQCIDRTYRDPDKQLSDPDVCMACNCNQDGITDTGLCSINPSNIPQCNCKSNVEGSQCSLCKTGYFSLSASNPDGCIECECNTVGTPFGSTACDADTGQCICKDNVQGLKCDVCKPEFTRLTSNNPDGCVACACSIGSVSNNCDPITSICDCQPGVQGTRCDVCTPSFHSLSTTGCQACQCDTSGSTSSICDVNNGNCSCKSNTEGILCDSCKDGFYDLQSSNPDGCTSCACNEAGTSLSSNTCDTITGNCNCKTNVGGRQCNQCLSGFFSLLSSDSDGCRSCQCNSIGTDMTGDICDVNTGQCECNTPAIGTRCDTCAAGFFLSNSTTTLCDSCSCNSVTSLNQTCDSITGQCACRIARQDGFLFGFGGRTCEACLEGFINFSTTGCTSCNCNTAGSTEVSCVEGTGQCTCKRNVEGNKCDTCKEGFGFLNANDPFGCSAVPTNLIAPTLSVLNSTSIMIAWLPPNSESAILSYQVLRNSTQIAQTTTTIQYTDTGLAPYTIYSYAIRATNNAGITESLPTLARTLEDIPIGVLTPTFSNVQARTVQSTWSVPTQPNGVITRYELSVIAINGAVMDQNVFSGLAFSTQVTDLQPFTQYTFILRACTSIGCGNSSTSTVTTTSAAPEQVSPPVASSITANSLQLSWTVPGQPNGVITQYQVFQRESPFTGTGVSIADLPASSLTLSVTGLTPFTQFEFAVSAATISGSTTSTFIRITTLESAPTGIISPTLTVQSSRSIQITWQSPTNPNAASLLYGILRTNPTPSLSVVTSTVTGSFLLSNLDPFTAYSFLLQVCSAIGCGNSSVVTVTTNEESPSGQQTPRITSSERDAISLDWDPPLQPNGIITSYTISRRFPAITLTSQPNHEKGIRFHGAGYARFTAGTFVPGLSTTIQFLVRTFSSSGILMLFSTASMSDYIVISYNSTSVQFAFDSGANSPTNTLTLNVAIANGFWHSITATRVRNEGTLRVNSSFTVQNTVIGSDNEIASSVLAFVGGVSDDISLPNGFPVLAQSSFAGCMRDVNFNSEMVDFGTVQSSKQLNLGLDGCPLSIEEGTHYSGAGFAKFDASVINLSGDTFEITFDLRTIEPSSIIFAIGQDSSVSTTDFLVLSIFNSVPILSTQIGGTRNTLSFTETVVTVCNGQWHGISLRKTQTSIILTVDQTSQTLNVLSSVQTDLLFIGGVNVLSPFYSKLMSSSIELTNFGGCLRNLEVNNNKLDYTLASEIQNVDIDGCPSMAGACSAVAINDLNSGDVLNFTDSGLQSFREYYYRVRSENGVGSTVGNWQRASTQQGVPSQPSSLQLSVLSSSSVQATWTPPTETNGVINSYYIAVDLAGSTIYNATVPDTQTILSISGLSPFTSYTVSVSVQLTSGTSSSPVNAIVTTLEDAPIGVSPPTISAIRARNATFTWQSPSQPNGIITNYSLILLAPIQSTVYTGDTNTFNTIVLNLSPYTDYEIVLKVCTMGGCADSDTVQFRTDEDIPENFDAPTLIVLDSRRIFVQWMQPSLPNGVITSFTVLYALVSTPSNIITAGNTNSTALEFTVAGLLPAMQYQFSVRATNRIGSVTSAFTLNSTLTDVPEGISPPSISTLTAFGFTVTWQAPTLPNGDVIEYRLLLGQIQVFTGLQLQTTILNLQPFTQYTLRIQACTSSGCGTSDSTQTRTLESTPEGIASPTLISRTSTSITIQLSPVTSPNGVVAYTLYIVGVFNDSIGSETRIAFTGDSTGMVVVESLVPFNDYRLFLDANNTVGGIRSESVTVQTLGTAPSGFSAPTQLSTTATTLSVSWNPPSIPNGDIASYSLYGEANGIITGPVIVQSGSDLNAMLMNLRPATVYSVYVVAFNQFGNGTSDSADVSTLESVPEDQPAPTLSQIQSRSLLLSWTAPSTPNGILTQYIIIQNGIAIMNVSRDVLASNIPSLIPFTQYRFAIEACTAVGCFRSDETLVNTLEDVPENISPPILSSQTSTTVLILWSPPLSPNGVILAYTLERSLPSNNNTITEIATRAANESLLHVDDDDTVLRPFLTVLYRITAYNRIGGVVSMFASITTLSARPVSILPPTLSLIQATSIQINWIPPLIPNGIITEYIIKYNPTLQPNLVQSISLQPSTTTYTQNNLSPYLNYSFTVTACTTGGCTESSVVLIETGQILPTGFAVISIDVLSAVGILISWVEPSMPNGVVTNYILNRLGGDGSMEIFRGLALSYNDSNLLPFNLYQYQLYVTNGAGSTQYGNTSLTRTLASTPLSGANLTISTTNSSIIQLQWTPPSLELLRGEVVNYEVVGYQLGSVMVISFYNGTDTMFSVTNLNPSTTYVFKVILSNGVGTADSNSVQATTLDGAPRGVSPPLLSPINATSVRTVWLAPEQPNGVIISYNLLRDGQSVYSSNMTGEFIVTGLTPFTVYSFLLVACTRFECTDSNASSIRTLQAPPTGLAAPNITQIRHDSFMAIWAPPSITYGEITSYSLYLRSVIPCSQSSEQDTCDYVECVLGQSQCGTQCYFPSTHVCCQGMLYSKTTNFACCNSNYTLRSASTDVCCAGTFQTLQTQSVCCGGLYQVMPVGGVCCEVGASSSVGVGDSCCGLTPFTDTADTMCCGDTVVAQHINTMCCGGSVETTVGRVCCNGVSYATTDGFVCCDTSYVAENATLCCTARNGVQKVISYNSPSHKLTANEKCCDITAISSQLSCCNNRGYDSQIETCADRSTSTVSNCGTGVTCPNSLSNTAYCNRCDFAFSTRTCATVDKTLSTTQTCYLTTIIFTGLALGYNVTGLLPFMPYFVYVEASNAAGAGISPEVSAQTLESTPLGLLQPSLTPLSSQRILIEWSTPIQPNGIIIHYFVNRDAIQVAMVNSTLSYLDDELSPFTLYTYTISACTRIGCTQSEASNATTFESPPSNLSPPVSTGVTSMSIVLSWSPPSSPNGMIQNYTIQDDGNNIIFSGNLLSTTVTGLSPFTEYTFTIQACNNVDCVTSSSALFTTSEIVPTGIDPPILQIIQFDVIEISWSPPTSPNGIIQYFVLRKNENIILNSTNLTYTDTDIFASSTYRYTIEVFNSVGSILSGAASITTPDSTPSGLDPPTVTALNATAVRIEWQPPTLPNGVIVQYELYQDNFNFITITISDVTQLSYIQNGLDPFTQYNFRVAACTRNGCAISTTTQQTTLEAPPTEIAAPFLLALSSSSLRISWNPPNALNGIITGYELLQTTPQQTPVLIPIQPQLTISEISSLNPFTEYTYTVKARNSAGSVTSGPTSVRTFEDVPMLFNAPLITNVTARTLLITWNVPMKPNGIITLYAIYARLLTTPLNPIPINREPVLYLTVGGNVTASLVQDLEPGSSYEFRIAANNSVGQVITAWVPVSTAEDRPESLQPIQYNTDPSGTALDLFWAEPLKPNGIINLYNIILISTGSLIFRGVSNSFTYRQLTPFTQYDLYLQACTTAGCTNGNNQAITTAEVAPTNQNPPILDTLGPSSIRISWQLPLNPNGIITRFRIERGNPDGTISLIHTVLNTTQRNFIDTGLLPYTIYNYSMIAENSVGETQSEFSSQRTDEGIPTGLERPTVIPQLSTEVLIQWTIPSSPNGVITNYDVIRNGSTINSLVSAFEFRDRNLNPFTYYSYQIKACNTRGGCVTSPATLAQTLESIPEGVITPSLNAISFSQVEITWSPPTIPNGIVQRYMLRVNDVNGSTVITSFMYTLDGLSPATGYAISIIACTSIGCNYGPSSSVLTLEYIPSGQPAPGVSTTSPKSSIVSWGPPTMANGIIIRYDVIRNGTLIQSTNDTQNRMYADTGLAPAMSYEYTIRAYTMIGASDPSPGTLITTSPDAPELVRPPTLTALSSSSFNAVWFVPLIPNGIITRYDLIVGGNVIFTGLELEYNVTGLTPFTVYNVQIRACTTTCSVSSIVSIHTNPDTPSGQPAPVLSAHSGPSVFVQWSPPSNPNGLISEYQIFRREEFNINGQITFSDEILAVTVTGVLQAFDNSTQLKFYTTYQYKVVVVNLVGSAISEWTDIRTVEGIPQDVVPPALVSNTFNSITIRILPPLNPNGIIRKYIVFRGGMQFAELAGTDNTTTLTNLLPYTIYQISVMACTVVGCNGSETADLRSGESTPDGVSPPTAQVISSRNITFTWTPPTIPNGVIISYSIMSQTVCPQPPQPHILPGNCENGPLVIVYTGGSELFGTAEGLTPYATFQFFIIAHNSQSSKMSGPSSFYETLSADPESQDMLGFRRLCNTVTIDWTLTFALNGLLKNFEVFIDTQLTVRTGGFTSTFSDLSYNTTYEFRVRVVTSIGIAEQSISINITIAPHCFDPSTTIFVTPTQIVPSPVSPSSAQAIIVIIIAVLIVLGILFCCFVFCLVIIASRRDRDRYRTQLKQTLTPLLDSDKIDEHISDLTLQESLMLENRSNNFDLSLPRSKQSVSTVANSSISYANSVRTPPSMGYSPRLTHLDAPLRQTSDIDTYSQDESGFRDTKL